MKQLTISIILVMITLSLKAQHASITPELSKELTVLSASDYVKVNLVLSQQVNYGLINAQFKMEHTPLSDRAKIVIRKSKQMAKNTQKSILDLLDLTISFMAKDVSFNSAIV